MIFELQKQSASYVKKHSSRTVFRNICKITPYNLYLSQKSPKFVNLKDESTSLLNLLPRHMYTSHIDSNGN